MRLIRQHIFISIVFLIGVACTSNTIYKKPKDLIPEKRMTNLLTDLFVAQGVYEVENQKSKNTLNYYPAVLEHYKVDSTQLASSLIYYISKMNDYQRILKNVSSKLQIRLDSLKNR